MSPGPISLIFSQPKITSPQNKKPKKNKDPAIDAQGSEIQERGYLMFFAKIPRGGGSRL
jgi:hypothetical protein